MTGNAVIASAWMLCKESFQAQSPVLLAPFTIAFVFWTQNYGKGYHHNERLIYFFFFLIMITMMMKNPV